MIKTISSRLSAQFNVDGSHLEKYLNKKGSITNSLCEDLILHDQVLIPTPDFLTADGFYDDEEEMADKFIEKGIDAKYI